jgi:hypothetical protein
MAMMGEILIGKWSLQGSELAQGFQEGRIMDGFGTVDDGIVVIQDEANVAHISCNQF